VVETFRYISVVPKVVGGNDLVRIMTFDMKDPTTITPHSSWGGPVIYVVHVIVNDDTTRAVILVESIEPEVTCKTSTTSNH
jgi:hypothetical protein